MEPVLTTGIFRRPDRPHLAANSKPGFIACKCERIFAGKLISGKRNFDMKLKVAMMMSDNKSGNSEQSAGRIKR
jgi:hypothetical protein